jgi:AbrB family looped-hinge helix DNA binding protein
MAELLGRPRQIDERNRITLPAQVMELLNLKPNDEIYFKFNDGKIILGKAHLKYEYIEEFASYKKNQD